MSLRKAEIREMFEEALTGLLIGVTVSGLFGLIVLAVLYGVTTVMNG